MVESRRSTAAAAYSQSDGSGGGGKDSRGRGKRPSASPHPQAPPSPSKRGKWEEHAEAAAAGEGSRPGVTGDPLVQKRHQLPRAWGRIRSQSPQQGGPFQLENIGQAALVEKQSRWQSFRDGLKQAIISPGDIKITLNSPYYASGTTNEMLLSSAVICMEKEFRKRMEEISSTNRRILLSGPAGSQTYQEALIKALAKHCDARLLILDSHILCGDQESQNELRKEKIDAPSTSSGADIVGIPNRKTFREDELQADSFGIEDDTTALGNLFQVIAEESKGTKLIVFLKDVESFLKEHKEWLRTELPFCVLIIGSQTQEASGSKLEKCETYRESINDLNDIFPNKISLEGPQGEVQFSYVMKQLGYDTEMVKGKAHAVNVDEGTSLQRIHDTFAVLPPAPNSNMVGYENHYIDLWAFGQAVGPWAETWRQLPLIFHDADIVEAVEISLPDHVKWECRDETDTISKVLKKHPGPIRCLRLDCTACPGPGMLHEWVDMLSGKEVQELVLINVTRTMENLEFPLHRLQSHSLRSLALGFFGLAALHLDLYDNLASIRDLNLSGCCFSGKALSAVIGNLLPELSSLTVGCSDLTAGCDGQGLLIDSRTLKTLNFWKCSAASGLTIAYAPALEGLTTSLVPDTGAGQSMIFIDLRSTPVLRMLNELRLQLHQLRISSDHAVWFNGRRVFSLPCLETLVVFIQLRMPHQAAVFVRLLGGLPRLQKITICRLDELSPSADTDDEDTLAWSVYYTPRCIIDSLRYLIVRDYRGGSGEIALIRCLLSAATRLISLKLQPHPTTSLEHAGTPFQTCPTASRDCTIVVEEPVETAKTSAASAAS